MDETSLVRKRANMKSQLTRFNTYLESISLLNIDHAIVSQLQTRLETIVPLLKEFNEIQIQLSLVQDEDDASFEIETEYFETKYFSLVSKAKQFITIGTPNTSQNCIPTHSINNDKPCGVKLPTIQLQTFSGSYDSWVEFKDTFNSLINNNSAIPDVQKFLYLKGCLISEAKDIIQSLQISEANYNIAWRSLTERYDNKRLIAHSHIKALLNLPFTTKESPVLLRQLLDGLTKNLRALENLKQPVNQWDTLLIFLMTDKLDTETKRSWEMNKTGGDFPTIEDFKAFLKNRCEILESLNFDAKINPHSKQSLKPAHKRNQGHEPAKTFVSQQQPLAKQVSCRYCQEPHSIYQCESYKNLSESARITQARERKLCINCLGHNHFSNSCKARGCRLCGKRHHTLLHLNPSLNTQSAPQAIPSLPVDSKNITTADNSNLRTLTNHVLSDNLQQTLLSTVIIQIQDNAGRIHNARALLDSGSQSSFITKEFSDKLGLKSTKINLAVTGINQIVTNLTDKMQVTINSLNRAYQATISCIIISQITGNVPNQTFDASVLKIPKNLRLADKTFNVASKVDLLIGAQTFWDLICIGQIKLNGNTLTLQKTKLGWIIAGPLTSCALANQTRCHLSQNRSDLEIQNQLRQFWEIENYPETTILSPEEKLCENHFLQNTQRAPDGRFIVAIPFRESLKNTLGDSKQLAIKRFMSIERKLAINDVLSQQYADFMKEYVALGHMTEVSNEVINANGYYLPHHCVIKESSITTKIRVVFDGSAKSTTGVSLNDTQMVGPVIQDDLFSILIRFRDYKYVLSADIAKMYRQVLVRADHRDFQRIFWRQKASDPLIKYQLNTVTYGTASASFLAIRALQQLAHENHKEHPNAANIILRNFYVDDLLFSTDSVENAKTLRDQLIKILAKGGFQLRKWVSNQPQILDGLACSVESMILTLGSEGNTKTLGLLWSPVCDTLGYKINVNNSQNSVTKRSILSAISQIFDPLGLLAPSIVIAKTLLQKLWQQQLTWDESLPNDLHTQWLRFQDELRVLGEIKIPRHVIGVEWKILQMHGFSDASETAYGASVYIRSISNLGNVAVRLLAAKSKVAPLKSVSIPKLELCAALLLAKLVAKIKAASDLNFQDTILWSDSTVALAWIDTPPNLLKTFVANRVAEIQDVTKTKCWRHVPSGDNPADLLSRGVYPSKLIRANIWWNGPPWLLNDKDEWPPNYSQSSQNNNLYLSERRQQLTSLITANVDYDLIAKFSSFIKLQRVCAFILRFKNNSLSDKTSRNLGMLTLPELSESTRVLIKMVQHAEFAREIRDLKENRSLNCKSKLLSLNPFLGADGILRVGGRLQGLNAPNDKKFPMILPRAHKLTDLIITHEHTRMLHAGPQAVLASLRERYWPLSGRNSVRKITRRCITCFRAKPRAVETQMGSLPIDRITHTSPFHVTGIDYCGPILIKNRKGRGCKITKAYVCIFICFTSKAVHLELVSDLSTEAFLACFRRFVSRRGKPATVYSDNGTNFIGAAAELKRFLISSKLQEQINNSLDSEGIIWKFIPPRSPHFGGLWEAGVKTIKHHLRRVMGNTSLTFEELSTVLAQIEAVVNSRPLSPLSSDPNDLCPLTPSHLLIGKAITALPDHNWTAIKEARLSRFQRAQQITQHFWTRWSKEYLSELQTRSKWKVKRPQEIQPGTMVVIREDNLPPLKWRLGRVINTFPGPDGVVRVAEVKFANNSVHKRAVTKLCVLPIN